MKITLLHIAILFSAVSCVAQNMNFGEMINSNFLYQISYSNSKKGIHEKVKLRNGEHTFIFDTGAPLCISKEIQKQNNYRVIERVQVHDSNNQTDSTEIVLVDTISFGGIYFTNIPALVLDFKNSPIKNENVQGLLGSNVVRFLTVEFDLKNGLIKFTDKLENMNVKGVEFRIDNQSNAWLPIFINQLQSDTANFDTGMEGLFHMNINVAKKLHPSFSKLKKKKKKPDHGMFGSGNSQEQIKIKAKSFIVAGVDIGKVRFNTTPAKSRIGRELLKYGVLTIDYPNNQLFFQPYKQ
jgi:hypothetical protein